MEAPEPVHPPAGTGGTPTNAMTGTGGAVGTGSGGAGMGSGGTAPVVDDCTPDPAGNYVADAAMETVLDQRTCLTWMVTSIDSGSTAMNDPNDMGALGTYYDAAIECENSTLGGFTDWRVPTLDEAQSIVRECQNWGGDYPYGDGGIFVDTNPTWWTSLQAGEKYCHIDAQQGGSASNAAASGPGVRCVRGTGTVGSGATCNGCPI